MSGMRKRQQEFLAQIRDLPVEVTGVELTGSNHLKVFLEYHNRRRFFILAGSCSDHRAPKNFRCTVCKWINQESTAHAS